MTHVNSHGLKQWLKLNRLIPLLTIIVAGTTGILATLGILKTDPINGVVITLLALLAVDSLVERVSILERIENRLQCIPASQSLNERAIMPSVEDQAASASEICIAAVSGVSVFNRHFGFLERKIKEGCAIRVVLLNPDAPAVKSFNQQYKLASAESDIKVALIALKELLGARGRKGRCEVRLLDIFLPYSMFAADTKKATGSIVIEYHAYKTTIGDRPHVYLTPTSDPYWFKFYREQFETAWTNAAIWTPD